jgi:hypothetical protein
MMVDRKCFGKMYELSEEEMCKHCVLDGCRYFNQCEKKSSLTRTYFKGPEIPMEPAIIKEPTSSW